MGINENLEEVVKLLKEQAEDKNKTKKFRLPKKVGSKKKKNYVTVLLINENSSIEFKKIQIEDQSIIVDGIPRLAAAGYVMYYKKNPVIILPSWTMEPFSPLQHYQESLLNGTNNKGIKILLAKMEKMTVDKKKQAAGAIKWIVLAGLGAIIAYAILSGG